MMYLHLFTALFLPIVWAFSPLLSARGSTGNDISKRAPDFPVFSFTQRLDHFDSTYESYTFEQKYWVSTRNYNGADDAPVILLDGGGLDGKRSWPIMDSGILEHLTKATGGIGVILEQRYSGESIPVQNFSTDSLAWFTHEQQLEDGANFMRNVDFSSAGVDKDMSAPNAKWIYIGSSQGGARAAHMRVQYPDIVYGAIASSAVIGAEYEYWPYYDIIRGALDPTCSNNFVENVKAVDAFLDAGEESTRQVKTLFGLQNLTLAEDFVSAIFQITLLHWSIDTWNSEIPDSVLGICKDLEVPPNGNTELSSLPYGDKSREVEVQLESSETLIVDYVLANFAKVFTDAPLESISSPGFNYIRDVLDTTNDTKFLQDDLSEVWRPSTFQVCAMWGSSIVAPPDGIPSIVSRRLDNQYVTKRCQKAFPPGNINSVPNTPNIAKVNDLGGWNITADRLAFIDGEFDPGRGLTAHSTHYSVIAREDTIARPYKLIPGARNAWDMIGMTDIESEPEAIRQIHKEEIDFVRVWLTVVPSPRPANSASPQVLPRWYTPLLILIFALYCVY